MIKHDYAGSQRVAMRVCTGANGSCATSTLTYLHADHLGSASLSTNASGGKVSEMRSPVLQAHYPYGETRSGAMATDRQFTGQRREIGLGLYDYNARYYDPLPGRFLSADSMVPGAASGSGGGAATLGYDSNTRLTPLTVNLGEFAAQVNAENREVLQFGAFFQWDSKTRQEHNVPMGPGNPQALNRYAYCLNNPLRYVDPTGHDSGGNGQIGYESTQDANGNLVYRIWMFDEEMYVAEDCPQLTRFMMYANAYAEAQSDGLWAMADVGVGLASTAAGGVLTFAGLGTEVVLPVIGTVPGSALVALGLITIGGGLYETGKGAWNLIQAVKNVNNNLNNSLDMWNRIYSSSYNLGSGHP